MRDGKRAGLWPETTRRHLSSRARTQAVQIVPHLSIRHGAVRFLRSGGRWDR
jgi:hypothetical protein